MGKGVAFLSGIFTVSGLAHILNPEPFEGIVPEALPARRQLVYGSGGLELLCAILLVLPVTRRLGGRLSVLVLAGVFPANINMAVQATRNPEIPLWYKIATLIRLPLQFPLIAIARRAARGE